MRNQTVTGGRDEGTRRATSPSIIVEDDDLRVLIEDEETLPSLPSMIVDRKGLLPVRRVRAKTIK
jgi:hypothetical protein